MVWFNRCHPWPQCKNTPVDVYSSFTFLSLHSHSKYDSVLLHQILFYWKAKTYSWSISCNKTSLGLTACVAHCKLWHCFVDDLMSGYSHFFLEVDGVDPHVFSLSAQDHLGFELFCIKPALLSISHLYLAHRTPPPQPSLLPLGLTECIWSVWKQHVPFLCLFSASCFLSRDNWALSWYIEPIR